MQPQPVARNPYYSGTGEFIDNNRARVFSDSEPKATTRIIYNNANNNHNNFRYREMYDDQLDCVNLNNNNFGRQMGGGSFYGDSRQNWSYSQPQQRLQGQTRFVKIQGPNKMYPPGFRHVMVKQQHPRQNQNRRIGVGGRNYYNNTNYNRNRRMMGGNKMNNNRREYYNFDGEQTENEKAMHGSEISATEMHTFHDVPGSSEEQKVDTNLSSAKARESPRGADKNGEKKSGFRSSSLMKDSLSYENLTDDSDENGKNGTVDLRERLLRRKQEQVSKREPGELDSEDEKVEVHSASRISGNGKLKKRRRTQNEDENLKINKASRSRARSAQSCHNQKVSCDKMLPENNQAAETGENGKKALLPAPYTSPESVKKNELDCRSDHGMDNSSSKNFCCPEAEILELREGTATLKRLLRETRDKLLEAKVIGSKNVKRMEEEISQLKERLDNSVKEEDEMKATLKELENELVSRRAELGKLTMLYEAEREEKLKHEQDLTRTYQDRLTIEVEKLRALFDIEVSKMQAFYLSSMCYEDNTVLPFLKPQKRELSSHLSLSAHQKVTQTLQKDTIANINPEINHRFFHSLYDGSSEPQQNSHHSSAQSLYRNNGPSSTTKYPYNNGISMQDIYSPNITSNGGETGSYSPANGNATSSSHNSNTNNRF